MEFRITPYVNYAGTQCSLCTGRIADFASVMEVGLHVYHGDRADCYANGWIPPDGGCQ